MNTATANWSKEKKPILKTPPPKKKIVQQESNNLAMQKMQLIVSELKLRIQ